MLPKVTFKRSWLYDEALKRERGFFMPSDVLFDKRIRALEKLWKEWGRKMLRELETVTKLSWHELDITCYITAGVISYSDPLTITVRKNAYSMFDTLTHELIHRILSEPENYKIIHRNWCSLMTLYQSEKLGARTHAVIHAIHTHILKKFFGMRRLKKEMERIRHPNYIRAWNIVKRDGYQNIIAALTKGLR